MASWFQAPQTTKSEVNKPFRKLFPFLDWHLVKKKISSKINVQRPDEEFLLKFKDSHDPMVNYAEDHILNTVGLLFFILIVPFSLKHCQNNNR